MSSLFGRDKANLEVGKSGNLYYLINAFIGAYNRRTDALVNAGGGSNNAKLDHIIELLDSGVHIPDLGFINAKLDLILGLLESPQPKPLEVKFVFKVADDHQDETFSISIGGVTDAEGQPISDPTGLSVDVKSSDASVVAVSFDPESKSGSVSFGSPGVASLTASVTNAKGDILGSGAADFTVTTGDPAAVSDVKIAFGGLTEETPPDTGGGTTSSRSR